MPAQAYNPFPGLRPFEFDDNPHFFGRDEQTTELTTRLRKNRFVAVVGTSGSGKSSLVRAGLLPELLSGTMSGAGSSWETAIMRPGGDPLTNLAQSMVDADLYDPEEEDIAAQVRATLTRSGLGLVEAIRQSDLSQGTNFLLVVDQFEEIFRFRRSEDATDEQAAFFVNLLLEASAQTDLPLYVIITMRSDFLGECSQFPRLADTVNEGEFLIPRLNRDQRKEAILGPVKVAGGGMTDRLLLRLLNDIGDDPDQLPILQHALMRTWDLFAAQNESGDLDLEHYHATGGMNEALSRHADEVYGDLPDPEHQRLAQKLFKSLTEKVDANRGIRRPMALKELHEICGGEEAHLRSVVDAFRRTGCTFLMPAGEAEITLKTIIDISHESLMRVWRTLKDWVDDEAQSAKIYRRLADTASLYANDKAGLYRDPDLGIALAWRQENQPNQTWADRYYPGFPEAMAFLEASQREAEREAREKEEARKRELAQAQALAEAEREKAESERRAAIKLRRLIAGLTVAMCVAVCSSVIAYSAMQKAKKSEEKAILNLVSSTDLTNEDVRKGIAIIERDNLDISSFAASLRNKAQNYLAVNEYNSAKVAITAATKIDEKSKEGWLLSGRIHSRLDDEEGALHGVQKFVDVETNNRSEKGQSTIMWMKGAATLGLFQNQDNNEQYCEMMFEIFPSADAVVGERIAKACLMLKCKSKVYEKAKSYALIANDLRKSEGAALVANTDFTVALAYYRSGDLNRALEYSNRSMDSEFATYFALKGLNTSLMSLISIQQGDAPRARAKLQEAKQILADMDKQIWAWHDLIFIEILIKEAEQLIGQP